MIGKEGNVGMFTSLKIRLLAGTILLLILLFGGYSVYAVWNHERQLMAQVNQSADRISEFIKSSTHYSMLLNRKEDVYRAMKMIGTQPGVEGLRIYNKRGLITFSTDTTERGVSADLMAEACVACHAAGRPLESLPTSNRIRIYEGPTGRILGLINPIRNEQSCSSKECHLAPDEKKILGVLDVRMTLSRIDASLADVRLGLILVALALVSLVAGLIWLFLDRTVLRPITALIEGTQQVSNGNLEYRVDVNSPGELGQLAESFNIMTVSVKVAQAEIQEWTQTLEQRVREKTEELTSIHDRIAHVEKMSSLGRLSATVAHELNNPLEAILTYTKLLKRQIFSRPVEAVHAKEWDDELEIISRETQRCGDIVKNLLLFSKKETGEFVYESVQVILSRSYKLMKHHFEMQDVRFEQHILTYPPQILCDPQQIQQALIAMFVNSADAMADGGTLTVDIVVDMPRQSIVIAVTDTGTGIKKEDLPQVFEPFFSTKEGGQGVGLGLSVVYGIVQRHGGSISVDSAPGRGTTFRLSFPIPDPVSQGGTTDTHDKKAL
jgi:two-component system NtrC family sensor kinase